ncbi:MAG: hypothetical protein ACJAS1_007273 [Oleiphilaceae bacterium]|jgi:hypothetical protein
MLYKKFKGIEFVKVATFDISENPYTFKIDEKEITSRTPTRVNFVNQSFLKAERSTYLVVAGTEYREKDILYVGVYTNSLKQSWLRLNKGSDFNEWISWHGDKLDSRINKLLKETTGMPTEVSLWLTVNPYLDSDVGPVNISHSIEQFFLRSSVTELPLKFNKQVRAQPEVSMTKTVRELLEAISVTPQVQI